MKEKETFELSTKMNESIYGIMRRFLNASGVMILLLFHYSFTTLPRLLGESSYMNSITKLY